MRFWCVNIYRMGILSFPFRMSIGPEVWADINCSTRILFANLFLPLSSNYSKEIVFHFQLIFAWFHLGILVEGTRAGYVLSAKDVLPVKESLAYGKLRKKKYLHQVV